MTEGQSLDLTRQPALPATTLLHLSHAESAAQASVAPRWGRLTGWGWSPGSRGLLGICGTRPHPCAPVHVGAYQVGLGASHTNTCMHLGHVSLPTCMHILCVCKHPPHIRAYVVVSSPSRHESTLYLYSPTCMFPHGHTYVPMCTPQLMCGWSVPPHFSQQESILPFLDL